MRKIIYFIVLLFLSLNSFAEKSSGGGGGGGRSKQGYVFMGLLGGQTTTTDSQSFFFPGNLYGVTFGMESRVGSSSFVLGLGVSALIGSGKANYDYTGSDSIHYVSNNLSYLSWNTELDLSLKFLFLDTSFMNIYAGAALMAGSSQIWYPDTTTLRAQGGKYKPLDDQVATGYYYEAGLTYNLGSAFATRIGARFTPHTIYKVDTLAGRQIKYNDSYYFVGFVRDLK